MSSGSFQLGHHRIVTYGKQKYSFVPHSHAILHLFCAIGLFALLSPPHAFLSEFFFYSGSSIHSVLLCERRNFFSSHGRRGTFGNLRFMLLILCFDKYCFFKEFSDSYLPFGFKFLAWDYLYIIYYLPCFLSMGLLLSPPKTFLNVRWMEP